MEVACSRRAMADEPVPGTPPADPERHSRDVADALAASDPDAAAKPAFAKRPDLDGEAPAGPQTRHERQEAKRLAREAEQEAKDAAQAAAEQKKGVFSYVILGAVVLAVAGLAIWGFSRYEPPFTSGFVHWHAKVQFEICGQRLDLPCLKQTPGTVHGENFCGTQEFHHHYDNVIHMEGTFQEREDMAAGRFFDAIGMPVSDGQLWNYTNGMACPGGEAPGKVSLLVNGLPAPGLREYPLRDGDVIKLSFG
jgi:hypothetical protein